MADIRTITILPTQTVTQVQGNTGAGTQGTSSLSGIAPGTVLSGFIINRDLANNPILRTDSGDITFSSNFFLNIGSEVSIRIENSGGGTLAHILSVNGQPPEIAAEQSAFAQEPEVIVGENLSTLPSTPQASATATAAVPQTGTTTLTISGTLIAQPQQTTSTTEQLPTGTQLTLRVTNLTPAPTTIPDEILNAAPQEQTATPAPAATSTNQAFYSTYARAAGTPLPAIPTPTDTIDTADTTYVRTAGTPPPTVTTQTVSTSATPAPAATTQVTNLPPPAPSTTNAAPAPTSVQTAPAEGNITATVISNESSQETFLQTPFGIVRLQPETTLPPGSTVKFDITTTTPPAQTLEEAEQSTNAAPITQLAQQWSSLQQIVSIITSRDPAAGTNLIQNTMPWVSPPPNAIPSPEAPTQNLSAGLMLFIAALRGGDFRNWIGETNAKWVEDQGHDALIAKAANEFALLGRQFSEAPPQQWQALFFPIATGAEVHQGRLYVKRDRKDKGNQQGRKDDDTRFIIEVDMSQLGEMQMDGFVRRREKEVHFDLIIRSLSPLPKEVQQDILNIYSNTGQLVGYKGSLTFQNVREFPVNPMEDLVGHGGTVVA